MKERNRGSILIHHFAHYNAENCGHARESAYRIMTKEVIEKTKTIIFPGRITLAKRKCYIFKYLRFFIVILPYICPTEL